MIVLVVDGANVVGSRPTGWWRDRPGAAARLYEQLHRLSPADADEVVLVLEGAARRGVPEGAGRVQVVHAPGSGDDVIADLAARYGGRAVVVTADRDLRRRAQESGAAVTGPRWLWERVED